MFRYRPRHTALAASVALFAAAACRGDPASPAADVFDVSSSIISVVSANGGTAIDPAAGFTVTFNHAMMHTDSMTVVLHEGDRAGPAVATASAWASDRTKLTLTPAAPLRARTQYTVELRCAGLMGHSTTDHAAHHGDASMGGMHGGTGTMTGGAGMMRAGMHSGPHGMTFTFSTS